MRTSRLRRIERIIDAMHEPEENRRARITAKVDGSRHALKSLMNAISPEVDFDAEWPTTRAEHIEHLIKMETDPAHGPAYRRSLGIEWARDMAQ
jgi:hypothetical protein